MAEISRFGALDDGTEIQLCRLRAGELEAEILTWGAVVRRLRFAGRDMVLGLETLDDYIAHSPHMGAIVGRHANRIRAGRFTLDGTGYQLACNENGLTHLHGGTLDFGKRAWRLAGHDETSVTLSRISPDGEEGYPGTAEVSCRYSLDPEGALVVELEARSDAPTLMNLAHHGYFNLGGGADVLDHVVEIAADRFLPVDGTLVPTGEIRRVDWTPHDFREGRSVRRRPGEEKVIFDHNFCLADAPRSAPEFAAAVEVQEGVRMEVWTTEPGIQFYDGAGLNVPVSGLEGQHYGPHAGLCLEPQRWPDSPNQPDFAGAVLRPGETYRQRSEYRFS